MKRIIFLVVFFVLYQMQTVCAQQIKTPNGFQLGTGVNTGIWLSQTNKRGFEREEYMSENDFELISSMGFDHIRLPVDEEQLWDEKGNKEVEAFNLMHKAIEWSLKRNMRVIVDLHIIRSHYFESKSNTLWDDPNEQEKLIGIWEQLSGELKKYPNEWVAYELLNEAVANDHEDWNQLLHRITKFIRTNEPYRTLVIGANQFQKAKYFPYLKVPDNDPNIILSFHFYNPYLLTHYKTQWTSLKDYSGPVHYPGPVITSEDRAKIPSNVMKNMMWAVSSWDRKSLEREMMPAIKVSKELGLPLYCGEFGVYYTAPKEDALRWYTDMTGLFRKHNIAFSHWEYKSEFAIVTKDLKPISPLVDVLVKKK